MTSHNIEGGAEIDREWHCNAQGGAKLLPFRPPLPIDPLTVHNSSALKMYVNDDYTRMEEGSHSTYESKATLLPSVKITLHTAGSGQSVQIAALHSSDVEQVQQDIQDVRCLLFAAKVFGRYVSHHVD
jgi:hypothetical protein